MTRADLARVSHLLWQDAGSPEPRKRVSPTGPGGARCYLCASYIDRGVHRTDAFGPGFTDHDRAQSPTSHWVCCACVWLMGEKPPNTFRLWSVVYREDRPAAASTAKAVYPHGPHTHCTSKADVSEIVDVLFDPPDSPWVCSIADSGQIHILPWCRVNVGDAWTVRYEREDITATSDEFAHVLYHASALLAAGYIRDDIETLDPHPSKLVRHGIDIWRVHASPLKQWRRSGLLRLALSLTRKETYGATRDRTRARLDRRPAISDSARSSARNDGERDDGEDQPDRLVAAREGGVEVVERTREDVGRARVSDGGEAPDRDAARGQLPLGV